MTPNEHAQLLQELAECAEYPTELAPFEISDLAARACKAAEEIEAWREPTPEELFYLMEFELIHDYCETSSAYEKLMSSAVTAARVVLARFGYGGRVGMKNTDPVPLLGELGRFCEGSTLEGATDLAGRAYTAAAEEIEGREVESGAAMTCSLLAQYQSEVDVIESVAGFTDESTPVGEAWARICGVLDRFGGRAQPPREVPTLELVLKPIGDCWLQIKAPSGRQAAINLGPRGGWNDQTFIGSVILEVAELTRHLCEEGES